MRDKRRTDRERAERDVIVALILGSEPGVECRECHGAGDITCDVCGGRGCGECDGLGYLECPACQGLGVY
jgi:hypothetical protein